VLKPILGKKVNNARDCIEACRDTLCFTDCINIHWPGTTFEEQVNLEIDASYQEDISITIDSSSDNKESSTKETTSNTSFLTVPLPSLLDAPSISFTTGKFAFF
jgi:hypothetical protein